MKNLLVITLGLLLTSSAYGWTVKCKDGKTYTKTLRKTSLYRDVACSIINPMYKGQQTCRLDMKKCLG